MTKIPFPGEPLLQTAACPINGLADPLLVELRAGNDRDGKSILAGYRKRQTAPIGWITLHHRGLQGDILSVECETGEDSEPILRAVTTRGIYRAIHYLDCDQKTVWTAEPDAEDAAQAASPRPALQPLPTSVIV